MKKWQYIRNAKIVGHDIPQEEYRQLTGGKPGEPGYIMSRSELQTFVECPSKWVRGESEEEQTKAMEWGSLVDCILLDSSRFKERYTIVPPVYPRTPTASDSRTEKPWRSNARYCKKWENEQLEKGKELVKSNILSDAQTAKERLLADPRVAELLRISRKQVLITANFHDDKIGIVVPFKCLIDLEPPIEHKVFGTCLADLKTALNAHPRPWKNQVLEHWYHAQGALYLDAHKAATGQDRFEFLHVVQENTKPWEVGRRDLGPGFIKLGREFYIAALKSYCACLHSNRWPSYDDGTYQTKPGWTVVEPDPWMINRIPEVISF